MTLLECPPARTVAKPELCHIADAEDMPIGTASLSLCGLSLETVTCHENCPCPHMCVVCDALNRESS